VDGLVAHLLDHPRLLENRLRQQVLEAGFVQQCAEALVVGHPQGAVVPVKPVDHRLQREAGMEAGGARIAHDVAFRLGGCLRDGAEVIREEGEVAHDRSKFAVESAGLEGGEEGVQLGEVVAVAGLLPLGRFDDGREAALEIERWKWDQDFGKRL
jgi:hypothetical protein